MRVVALIISLSIFSSLSAQHNYMSLAFGISWPMKSFSEYSDLYRNGFALRGFSGDYSGAFFNKNNIGISGSIRYHSNPVDDEIILTFLSSEIPEDLPFAGTPVYRVGFWKFVSVFSGPEYTFPMKNMNFDLYIQGGINFILAPEMDVLAENTSGYFKRELDIKTLGAGFKTGGALRFHLNENSSVRLYADWFLSSCRGEVIQEINFPDNKNTSTNTYRCTIAIFNAAIGLVYRL